MSIRNITVQYVGDVLFLPKLERDVKLVVERDYWAADPDKRFVMERTCEPYKQLICDLISEMEYREKGCIRCHSTYWRMKAEELGVGE